LIPYFVFSAPTIIIPPPELASAHTYFEKIISDDAYFFERGIIESKHGFELIICLSLMRKGEQPIHERLGRIILFF